MDSSNINNECTESSLDHFTNVVVMATVGKSRNGNTPGQWSAVP